MNETCQTKTFPQRQEVHFIDNKPVIFDTRRGRLIGFVESITGGDRFLFRGENDRYFLLQTDPIGLEVPKIHPLSPDAALMAYNRMATKAGLYSAFPDLPRPKKA